jgi:hypothetical protein
MIREQPFDFQQGLEQNFCLPTFYKKNFLPHVANNNFLPPPLLLIMYVKFGTPPPRSIGCSIRASSQSQLA